MPVNGEPVQVVDLANDEVILMKFLGL